MSKLAIEHAFDAYDLFNWSDTSSEAIIRVVLTLNEGDELSRAATNAAERTGSTLRNTSDRRTSRGCDAGQALGSLGRVVRGSLGSLAGSILGSLGGLGGCALESAAGGSGGELSEGGPAHQRASGSRERHGDGGSGES